MSIFASRPHDLELVASCRVVDESSYGYDVSIRATRDWIDTEVRAALWHIRPVLSQPHPYSLVLVRIASELETIVNLIDARVCDLQLVIGSSSQAVTKKRIR